MSAVTDLWRQLVQRRLWPVAIALIAALAAVPLILAKEPDPAPAPAAPEALVDDELARAPIVTLTTSSDGNGRRHVLGRAKNPFAAAKPANDVVTTDKATNPVVQSSPSASPASGGSGGTATPGASAPSGTTDPPVTPAPAPKPTPTPKTYSMYELTVRFGDASGSDRQSLERLQPLPAAAEPVLIYLGVLKDGKTAVFLVDHGVQAIGDGDCRPSPDECETIRLRAGDTEFIDVKDEAGAVTAQYQLDLLKIHLTSTTSAREAKASSKAGQRLLRARVSDDGPKEYRWDDATGTLEKRPGRVLRGTFGRSAVALP